VEKQLGISGKPEIEKYGVEEFVQRCKESVFKASGVA
jgi:isoleucyl-tRNA synthetase